MSHPYAGRPAAARERERARLRQASFSAQGRAQPRGAPAPATSLPARAEGASLRPAPASGPDWLGPALLPRPVLPPLGPAWSRVRLSRRCRHRAPYLAVLTLGLGAPSGLALPPRRLPGLAGSPCLARPVVALATD